MPMVALVHPVYDCLIRLAQPDALMNEEEVRKNVLLFPFFYKFYWFRCLFGKLLFHCKLLHCFFFF